MNTIETNLKNICRQKGLSLTDVANRMGTDPSNLLSSIKGNPTLSKLQGIADALHINVSQLLSERPEPALGIAIIEGKTYQLSMPAQSTVQLPVYQNYSKLQRDIRHFIKKSITQKTDAAMMALVESVTVFALIYDPSGELFHLSLCHGDEDAIALAYDKYVYAVNDAIGKKEDLVWDIDDLMEDIMSDIDEHGQTTIEYRLKSPHYETFYTEEPI